MTENHFQSYFAPFQINTQLGFAPRTIGLFHCVLSMALPNMRLISEFMTKLDATSFLSIFSGGHFVFPIDAIHHRVLVIWDLNGYGE